jgi:hypothetical protein
MGEWCGCEYGVTRGGQGWRWMSGSRGRQVSVVTGLNGGASPSDTGVRFCVGVSVGWLVVLLSRDV